VTEHLPQKIYTEKDVVRAKKTGKLVGWIQGAGVMILAGMVLNLLGWIPTVAVVGVVGYVAYRLLFRSEKEAAPEE
jgi:MFS superfamily sulfate permease-like transporter